MDHKSLMNELKWILSEEFRDNRDYYGFILDAFGPDVLRKIDFIERNKAFQILLDTLSLQKIFHELRKKHPEKFRLIKFDFRDAFNNFIGKHQVSDIRNLIKLGNKFFMWSDQDMCFVEIASFEEIRQ